LWNIHDQEEGGGGFVTNFVTCGRPDIQVIFLWFAAVVSAVSEPLLFDHNEVERAYPPWAVGFGWFMILTSVLWIPLYVTAQCAFAPFGEAGRRTRHSGHVVPRRHCLPPQTSQHLS